ncbi:hypothetical protein [Levilactobacillus fujinensis]|uniref:Uncharacterized protein n=1 Tax=Levilactobacillus fujinensis TaxID=2486024 RepID=A0ABW1TBX4_9LACO|nr:hypothetical protein [Levilactobacillus fujinensis]
MARNASRFTRRQGFLTLWALLFLASVSLLLTLISVGQAGQRETTMILTTEYRTTTRQINGETQAQHKWSRW